MTGKLAIGVDIGGTKLAFVLIDEQGAVIQTHHLPTDAKDGIAVVLERIAQGYRALLDQAEQPVAGIGLGSPGLVNPTEGTVQHAVNLGWDNVPLRDSLRQRLGIDMAIWVQKDTNAGALGELYFGAAKGFRDFVYIAIGTGLGAGALVDGKLVVGANFNATELGHLVLDPRGRKCVCGLHGCIEMYVSGHGMLAGVHEYHGRYPESPLAQIHQPTTADVIQAARMGDVLALTVLNEAADALGMALAVCGGVLNPALFVIGGGLGHAAADFLLQRAEAEFRRRVLPPTYERARIVRSQLTDSAVGAASLVFHHLGK